MSRFTLGCAALLTALVVPFSSFAADIAKGKALFESRCATCHGISGNGDSPFAANLPPEMKPRDLVAGEFKFAKTDALMKQLIKEGGAAHGLNALMPAHSDIADADLDNVVTYVRSLKK